MIKNKGGSSSTKIDFSSLQDLTRWNYNKRIGHRKQHNKENVVNKQYQVPINIIDQALLDYRSGKFQFKKDVAKKHQISVQTLVHHANIRCITFNKKDSEG
ncbi:hypothetical protein [Vibrio coralliirubri]|uniref:hypothetical protein n=1 Tax=Vibrio coralliirubri TaxID=1516159 RepID=UPI00076AA63F|nr:hypothetical protein [Vibrio coralliirubri]